MEMSQEEELGSGSDAEVADSEAALGWAGWRRLPAPHQLDVEE